MLSDLPPIPFYTLEALEDYVLKGDMPGGFLTAVLKNDLSRAFRNADAKNLKALKTTHDFLYNFAPASCWGEPDSVAEWSRTGGIEETAPDFADHMRSRFRDYEAEHYETATA